MSQFRALLLDIWREACQHIEIGDATSLIAPRLANELPLERVLVRRLDFQRSCVETVGVGICDLMPTLAPLAPEHTRHELSTEAVESLLTLGRTNKILHFDTRTCMPSADDPGVIPSIVPRIVPSIVPDGLAADMLVGFLTRSNGSDGPTGLLAPPEGLLILVARPGATFDSTGEALIRQLLEPFSVALENDQRLREMRVLREAAEADRRSLLTKLGRQDFSEAIVGAEAGLKSIIDRVDQVARLDVPVLIFGETGSGKEVIARAIHSRSRRVNGPFLRVNCGAIPAELIDSELFGHERGSFTGAIATRKGWFERADGGTLFLDEVGELPLAAQVRLLRILQDGLFERVGGGRQMTVDVRIVAATHRNLSEMVKTGRFREDLWYRIAVFPIDLPRLADRLEDIPALATHFSMRACRRFGFPPLMPSPEEINLLCAYAWPGNIRELAAVIDRAAILGDGKSLEIARALGGNVNGGADGNVKSVTTAAELQAMPQSALKTIEGGTNNTDSIINAGNVDLSLDAAMVRHIEQVLQQTGGQIEGPHGAAHLLAINPHTLRARMRKLRIDWQRFRPRP